MIITGPASDFLGLLMVIFFPEYTFISQTGDCPNVSAPISLPQGAAHHTAEPTKLFLSLLILATASATNADSQNVVRF